MVRKYGEPKGGKERLVEETAENNWTGVLGLGALGIASSVGLAPMIIIALSLLAVGVVLTVYLLPVILAGAVAIATFFMAREAGLSGVNLVAATLVASLGSILLFSYTDFTLWSLNATSSVTGMSVGRAQFFGWHPFSGFVKVLQLMLGIVVTGFFLMMILMIRSLGEGAAADAVAGLSSAFITGIVTSSVLDFQIPGLAMGISSQGVGILVPGIIGFTVGLIVMYSSWRWD